MQKRRGFTFVEVLAALVMLGIMITGQFAVFTLCFRWNDALREDLLVRENFADIMEQVRNTSFQDIPANFNNRRFNLTGLNGNQSVLVSTTPAPASNDLFLISVTAAWTSGREGRLMGPDTTSSYVARR